MRLTPVATPRTTGLVCGHVIVELSTSDGLVGLGEMSDFQHLPRYHVEVPELERTLSELLVGLPAGIEGADEVERRRWSWRRRASGSTRWRRAPTSPPTPSPTPSPSTAGSAPRPANRPKKACSGAFGPFLTQP
ncbi:hypothetical protein [Flindersiella endophytica]